MQTEVRPIGPLERCLHVKVEAHEIESEVDVQIKDVASKARLPGFRQGNVPFSLIRDRYGSGILGEVRRKRLSDSLDEAVRAEDLHPIHVSNFAMLSNPEATELEYLVDMVVEPDLNLEALDNLRLIRPVVEITDHDIDKRIDEFLERNARFEQLDRPIEMGDEVYFKLVDKGSVFGWKHREDVAEAPHKIEGPYGIVVEDDYEKVGPWLYFLLRELIGKSSGDTFEVERDISILDHVQAAQQSDDQEGVEPEQKDREEQSEDMQQSMSEETTTQTISESDIVEPLLTKLHVEIEIDRAGHRVSPELNEEFFETQMEDVKDIEELRQRFRESMDKEAGGRSDTIVHSQIVGQFISMNPVELPTDMLQELAVQEHNARQQEQEKGDNGAPVYTPSSEDLETQQRVLMESWIVEQYAAAQNIEADIAKMNELLNQQYSMRVQFGLDTEDLHTEEHQRRVRRTVLTRSVLDHVMDKVDFEERTSTLEELNTREFFDALVSTEPEGGPFTWTSPVTQEEIDAARKDVEELRASREEFVEEQADEVDDNEETTNEMKKGFLGKLFARFGAKK